MPWNQIFLGTVGILVIAGGVLGSATGVPDQVAIALIVVGGGLVVLAAFWSRAKKVKLGTDGLEVDLNAIEKKVEEGEVEVVEAKDLPAALEAAKDAVSQFGIPTVSHGPPSPTIAPSQDGASQTPGDQEVRWRLGRTVQLVDDAVFTMATLSNYEQTQVQAEVARMSHPDFREEADPRAIRAHDGGRSYRVHKVPNTNLRLWYRPLDDNHPVRLMVVLIEKRD